MMMLLPQPLLLSVFLLLLMATRRWTEALAGREELTSSYPRSRTDTPTVLTAARGRGAWTVPVTNHRDPRHKEKFIIHLTGPLSINPKCKKQFYRLYHNTRDCTVPAYYRRCARLLIQLAKSPRCAER